MAIQITAHKETFLLHGQLNTMTTQSFIVHFEYIIEQHHHVVSILMASQKLTKLV